MKKLTITWQRLLHEGQTCPRCGSTEMETEKAVELLREALGALGIEVVLEKQSIPLAEFKSDTLQSNTIWLNGRLLEEWLGATTGQSPCCEVCGPNDCRTVAVGNEVYETIPAELIVRAGLLAAAQLLGPETASTPQQSKTKRGCCPS